MPIFDTTTPKDVIIELAAKTAHEVNRAYCLGLGDDSVPAWESAPDWHQASYLKGVRGVMAGNGPEQSHESWLAEKQADGWVHGPVKNPETKEHPCMRPYSELPEAQRLKDSLFVSAVKGILTHHFTL